ncbi:MAG: DUF1015 domain-containing protein [Ruminococcaceae bacterium]|nr:DUF1015 domain-containing protein [Oscillospiraceae bacterium]
MKQYIQSADILLPSGNFDKWAVVACDQYTSEPEYWDQVEQIVADHPSTLRVMLPEIYLEKEGLSDRIRDINQTMRQYLSDGTLVEHKNAMIYVERTQCDGTVRHGIVGTIDLEDYDYQKNSKALIRATEETVIDRLPPRIIIRKDACLEIPHILLLIDDAKQSVIEPLKDKKTSLAPAYSFDLMQGGGHIEGYFLSQELQIAINEALELLIETAEDKMLFAVGDGNHSLATAKECYKLNGVAPARHALVEIVNIHDPAIVFEPIYRVLFNVDPEELLSDFLEAMGGEYDGEDAQEFEFVTKDITHIVSVKPRAKLPIGTLQPFLDDYLRNHSASKIDYIHGDDVVHDLCIANNSTCGFIYKSMEKGELFQAVKKDGSLPRKTFSMGHACDKRFYLEARKIK